MRTISIGIGHYNHAIIVTIFYFEVVTNTCSNSMNNCVDFLILKISSRRAFSVLITLPRSGKIAWNLRSRPSLADPPAESPSTRYSSFYLYFYFVQELIYLITKYLYVYSFTRARIFTSFACCFTSLLCFNCFLTKDLDNWPFLLNRKATFQKLLNQQHFSLQKYLV